MAGHRTPNSASRRQTTLPLDKLYTLSLHTACPHVVHTCTCIRCVLSIHVGMCMLHRPVFACTLVKLCEESEGSVLPEPTNLHMVVRKLLQDVAHTQTMQTHSAYSLALTLTRTHTYTTPWHAPQTLIHTHMRHIHICTCTSIGHVHMCT